MKNMLTDLLKYNFESNQKVIDLLNTLYPNVSDKQLKLINHIINAQQIWNARICNDSCFDVWQINQWDNLHQINQTNYTHSINIITQYDVEKEIKYKNSKNQEFSNSIKDILFHIINHSTYHRAQIATELKMSGTEPINTDYIFYKRKAQ